MLMPNRLYPTFKTLDLHNAADDDFDDENGDDNDDKNLTPQTSRRKRLSVRSAESIR